MIREGWLVPAAQRSVMALVARVPKMARLLVDVTTIPLVGGGSLLARYRPGLS